MQAPSAPNPDRSSTIHVHHIHHGAPAPPHPQQHWQQSVAAGFPPYSPWWPPLQQQQIDQQGTDAVIANDTASESSLSDEGDGDNNGEGDNDCTDNDDDNDGDDDKKKSREFSNFSVVSLILFSLALVLGSSCIMQAHQAEYEHLEGEKLGIPNAENERHLLHRTVALGLGCAAKLFFTIATVLSFLAGMRTRMKGKTEPFGHLWRDGPVGHLFLVIASWIIFLATFAVDLVTMVLAFNVENEIYLGAVLVGFAGSAVSWSLMFGYSELARRC